MENDSMNQENEGFTQAPTSQEINQNPDNATAYNQNTMYNPNGMPQQTEGGNGLAIAGMVLGIVSLVCCCNTYISLIAAVVGLVLSILVLVQKKPGKGMAIAGVVCSAIALVIGVVAIIGVALFNENSDVFTNELLNSLKESGLDVSDFD